MTQNFNIDKIDCNTKYDLFRFFFFGLVKKSMTPLEVVLNSRFCTLQVVATGFSRRQKKIQNVIFRNNILNLLKIGF